MPDITNAHLGAKYAYLTVKNVPVRFEISPNTKAILKAYDEAGQVMPAGITLELVPPKVKLGARKRASDGRNPPRGRKRVPSHRSIFVEPEGTGIDYG